MKNTAPIGLGVLVVAGLFGLIGGAVSFVLFDWGFFAALVLAGIIATVVAIFLLLGWREPASPPVEAGTAGIGAGNAPTAAASPAKSAPAPSAPAPEKAAAAVMTDPQIKTDNANKDEEGKAAVAVDPQIKTDNATKSEEGKAAVAVDPQIKTDAPDVADAVASGPKVKTATTLPGENELSDRKAEWKYEGGGAAAAKAPVVDQKLDTPAKIAEATAPDGPGEKPELLTAARDGGADDLKQIKGVGPKMEDMLNEMGVYHFDQVASWSADEVSWVDQNLKGFKGRVSRDNWVDQAGTLAAGGETEFSKKVEKGGVY